MLHENDLKKVSKSLSLVLRHNAGHKIFIDANGYADVDEVCSYLATLDRFSGKFDRAWISEALKDSVKQRFAFSPDGSRIRAVSGHSFPVDLQNDSFIPDGPLYFGTSKDSEGRIKEHGLTQSVKLKTRLVEKVEDALAIAETRTGEPLVLEIDAVALYRAGFHFEKAEGGEILTDKIPAEFCQPIDLGQTLKP